MNRRDQPADAVQNVFDRDEVTCRMFRQAWKNSSPQKIEVFLCQAPEPSQPNLFRNLLNIELEFRRRARENPNANEYLRRFPQFARVIRETFFCRP